MSSDAELLARYVPFLRYDSLESYPADAVEVMTDCVPEGYPHGNTLSRRWRQVLAAAAPADGATRLDPGVLRGGRYKDGRRTRVLPGDHLDAVGKHYVEDARRMHAHKPFADKAYGYANRNQTGALYLQYWLFFYYNDKAMLGSGNHEGDWELVQLRIGADEVPTFATYSQHKTGERCEWGEVERKNGAPVVYVARGSHACHFRPGVYPAPVIPDHCDGEGPLVQPQLIEIHDEDPSWVGWPGRWGSTKHWPLITFLGADSPPGPKKHGSWDKPADFQRKARDAKQLGPMAGEDLPRPESPSIEARRENGRAVVRYQLAAPAPGTPEVKKLLLSLDGHGDELQPATYSFDVREESGTIELPLELGPRAYTVRAAAAPRKGVSSPATSTELAAP